MRFGVCAPLEKVDLLAAVGYDYIELGVQSALIPEASEEEFREIRDRASNAPLRPGAFAGFIPGDLRVVGDSLDFPRLSRYVETACRLRLEHWRGFVVKVVVVVIASSPRGCRSMVRGTR
jgi:sugar phosphate isomerase/epimerase